MPLAHRLHPTLATALPFAALLTLLSAGCEKKIAAVCEEKCGSDAQTCIDATEKDEATAEERGCEGEFEAYASCAEEKATCTKGVLDATAPCAVQIEALVACVQ